MSEEKEEYEVSEYNILLAENRKLKMELSEVIGKYEQTVAEVHKTAGVINKLQKQIDAIEIKREQPTLLDQFAMTVISGVFQDSGVTSDDRIGLTQMAYSYAKQMMKEREEWK